MIHWGESSQGEWKLQIADLRALDVGMVTAARLDLYGTDAPRQTHPWLTPLGFDGSRFKLRLNVQPGYRYEIQASTDMADWTAVATTSSESDALYEYKDDVASNVLRRFFRAIRTPLQP